MLHKLLKPKLINIVKKKKFNQLWPKISLLITMWFSFFENYIYKYIVLWMVDY